MLLCAIDNSPMDYLLQCFFLCCLVPSHELHDVDCFLDWHCCGPPQNHTSTCTSIISPFYLFPYLDAPRIILPSSVWQALLQQCSWYCRVKCEGWMEKRGNRIIAIDVDITCTSNLFCIWSKMHVNIVLILKYYYSLQLLCMGGMQVTGGFIYSVICWICHFCRLKFMTSNKLSPRTLWIYTQWPWTLLLTWCFKRWNQNCILQRSSWNRHRVT